MPGKPVSAAAERLTPAQARRLFGYNRRVFDRFVRRIRKQSRRFAHRRREIGHQTLFETLVHILNVQEVWIGFILQGRNSDAELEQLFRDPTRRPKDWKGFGRYRRRVEDGTRRYLARVTAAELARPVHAFWMPGRYVASDALWQVTLEQAHHLGEIIGALWQDDVEPPEMTWIRVGADRR